MCEAQKNVRSTSCSPFFWHSPACKPEARTSGPLFCTILSFKTYHLNQKTNGSHCGGMASGLPCSGCWLSFQLFKHNFSVLYFDWLKLKKSWQFDWHVKQLKAKPCSALLWCWPLGSVCLHAVLNTRDIDRRDDPQGLFSEWRHCYYIRPVAV